MLLRQIIDASWRQIGNGGTPDRDFNGVYKWLPECIGIAVVELTWAFANRALQTDTSLGTSTPAASQQAISSSYTSFSEALASAQASPIQFQNETAGRTAMVHEFQTGQASWQNTFSCSQSDGGSSNSSSAEASAPVATSTPKPGSDRATRTSDTYVTSGSKHHLQRAIPDASSHDTSPLDKSGNSKSTDKPNPRKDTTRTDSNVGAQITSQTGTAAPSESVPSIGETTKSGLTASGSEQPTTPSGPNAPALTIAARKPKANDSNADLAFAVKMQANKSQSDSTVSAITAAADTPDFSGQDPSSQFAVQIKTLQTTAIQKATPTFTVSKDIGTATSALVAVSSFQGGNPPTSEAGAEKAPEQVSRVAEVPEDLPSSAQPLKTVQVQITGTDNQRVDLRLMEKGGQLTMSVRSADGSLTKALQQNLPDLTTSLSEQQIKAEWWKPGVQNTESFQTPDSSSNSDGSHSSTPHDQNNQGKSNSGQQGGRNTPQTDWVEELSILRKSSQNGAQYTWHL